jgi:hypothetical protein
MVEFSEVADSGIERDGRQLHWRFSVRESCVVAWSVAGLRVPWGWRPCRSRRLPLRYSVMR